MIITASSHGCSSNTNTQTSNTNDNVLNANSIHNIN